MKSFKRILVVGEENIFSELCQIIVIAADATTKLIDMIDDCKNEKCLYEGMQAIRSLENKSDSIAFKVNEDITSGAVSPNILEHLLECVRVADDIVDAYYYQAREMCRMYKANFPYTEVIEEDQWIATFKSLVELAEQALGKVKQALLISDLSEILQLRKEIASLEQQGDEIKDKGFDFLYREAPQMHYLQFYHYSGLLHKFDAILDGCEDLSDLVLSVITSIIK